MIAKDTFKVRFHSPAVASRIVPGQFLMVRVSGDNDPLLGRAFALYDTSSSGSGDEPREIVEFVYLVGGKMTTVLSKMIAGQLIDVWGPLGNGFPAIETSHLIMVAGGIGQTPFLATGKAFLGEQNYGAPSKTYIRPNQVTLCYGARSAEYLAGLDEFRDAGIDVRISTDDGSEGHHGLVTDVLQSVLAESGSQQPAIFCCGPEPMMHAVSQLAETANVPCYVSLEAPMACGIGICSTSETKVRMPDGAWDYRRTCVEGPVFEAKQLDWD